MTIDYLKILPYLRVGKEILHIVEIFYDFSKKKLVRIPNPI